MEEDSTALGQWVHSETTNVETLDTIHRDLHENGDVSISSLSDADWTGSPLDRGSTFGYCTFFFGGRVEKSKAKSRCSF